MQYFFLTYLPRNLGEMLTFTAGARTIEDATKRWKPGQYIYRATILGDKRYMVEEDLTPAYMVEGYEPNYTGPGDGLIKTNDLGRYDVISDSFSRDIEVTAPQARAEQVWGLIKGIFEAEEAIAAVKSPDYDPMLDHRARTIQAREVRARLINALGEALDV